LSWFSFFCSKIIEPIQSRCAILRFGRLSDEQVLKRLREVLEKEQVPYNDKGLEALIFTADGDMRQALNNAQSTAAGFGFISRDDVYKVREKNTKRLI
jgi:replication factor C subunit 2/4